MGAGAAGAGRREQELGWARVRKWAAGLGERRGETGPAWDLGWVSGLFGLGLAGLGLGFPFYFSYFPKSNSNKV